MHCINTENGKIIGIRLTTPSAISVSLYRPIVRVCLRQSLVIAMLAHFWPVDSIWATYKRLLDIDGIGLGVCLGDGMAWCFVANKRSLFYPARPKLIQVNSILQAAS
jgi:hypothetical protein